jgi:hypothetical protein
MYKWSWFEEHSPTQLKLTEIILNQESNDVRSIKI